MEEKAGGNAGDVANQQTMLSVIEKSGHTQRAEGQRIVKEDLRQADDVRSQNELQKTEGDTGHHADSRPVPVRDQDDEKRRAKRHAPAKGHLEKLDHRGDHSQRDGCGRERDLSGRRFFSVAGGHRHQNKQGKNQNGHKNVARNGETEAAVSIGYCKKACHRKACLLPPALPGSSHQGCTSVLSASRLLRASAPLATLSL